MLVAPPYEFKTSIENKDEVWRGLFDRNASIKEFYNSYDSHITTKMTYLGRYKLAPDDIIGYAVCRIKCFNDSLGWDDYAIFPLGERYGFESFESQLRSKGYKYTGRIEDEKCTIYKKIFMFIHMIDCVSGQSKYLFPAELTQICTATIEETKCHYTKMARGRINIALDEFIRRKHNPTQKEVVDFLIALIGDREIYLSEDAPFIAQRQGMRREHMPYGGFTKKRSYFNKKMSFTKADFIASTDVETILRSTAYL